MIIVLVIFLASDWIIQKSLAHQLYNTQLERRFAEMYGESIPSNGVAIPIEELENTAEYTWPVNEPNSTDYLIETADGVLSWASGPKGLFHHITIGCECGNNLVCAISYQPEHWPLDITCIDCETRYITTREVAK